MRCGWGGCAKWSATFSRYSARQHIATAATNLYHCYVLILKRTLSLFLLLSVASIPRVAFAEDSLRIAGSQTVDLAVAEAAQILRAENRIQIQINTPGGST